jgi:hypothetical protein
MIRNISDTFPQLHRGYPQAEWKEFLGVMPTPKEVQKISDYYWAMNLLA